MSVIHRIITPRKPPPATRARPKDELVQPTAGRDHARAMPHALEAIIVVVAALVFVASFGHGDGGADVVGCSPPALRAAWYLAVWPANQLPHLPFDPLRLTVCCAPQTNAIHPAIDELPCVLVT